MVVVALEREGLAPPEGAPRVVLEELGVQVPERHHHPPQLDAVVLVEGEEMVEQLDALVPARGVLVDNAPDVLAHVAGLVPLLRGRRLRPVQVKRLRIREAGRGKPLGRRRADTLDQRVHLGGSARDGSRRGLRGLLLGRGQRSREENRGEGRCAQVHAGTESFGNPRVESRRPSLRTRRASAPGERRTRSSPLSGPSTKMAVESASASMPEGAATVTLEKCGGERPVAGSKMWFRERSALKAVE